MKATNEYAAALGDFFTYTPKVVLAAIAYSLITQGGSQQDGARQRLLAEWQTLHDNGIVHQKPSARASR